MNTKTAIDAIFYFLTLLARANRGNRAAIQRLSAVLPKRTHTAMVREIERAKDRAKYGR